MIRAERDSGLAMIGHQQEELVQLHRDTISTSWGFRLQGGQEANTPLTVQRVFVGGVADGKLHRGDVIVAIGGQNARGMYHSQAEEIIKGIGRDISFKVLRGGVGGGGGGGGESYATNDYSNSSQLPWQQPPAAAPSWSQPIAAPSWSASGPSSSIPDEDYEQRTVGDLKRQFQNPPSAGRIQNNPGVGRPSYIPKRPVIVKKPGHFEAGLSDPGWAPGSSSSHATAPKASRYVPQSPPVNSSSRQQHPHYATAPRYASEPIRHEPAEPPAWIGTLRSSGGPRLWELQEGASIVGGGARVPAPVKQDLGSRPVYSSIDPVARGPPVHSPRVQTARYGPGGSAPTYDQQNAEGVDSESARIAHLQYNTPIGLYSRDSAREALEGQTRGKAGYGTMDISGGGGVPSGPGAKIKPFDPAHSDVFRLVLEEDEVRKHGGVVHGGGGGGQGRQGPSRAAAAQPRQEEAPTAHEPRSARFYQLVHENDEQTDQYSSVHPGQYHHPEPGVAAMRDVETRFDDMGVSDF